jgi:hypothetical protein
MEWGVESCGNVGKCGNWRASKLLTWREDRGTLGVGEDEENISSWVEGRRREEAKEELFVWFGFDDFGFGSTPVRVAVLFFFFLDFLFFS